MSATANGEAIHRAIDQLAGQLQEAADIIALERLLGNTEVQGMLLGGLNARFSGLASAADARERRYRCRLRIYDTRNLQDPVVDSDADKSPGEPGETIVAGLPNVASEMIAAVRVWHAAEGHLAEHSQLVGLGPEEIARRLRSLRPTISRHKAAGRSDVVLRMPYDTFDSFNGRKSGWLMRVDILILEDRA